MLGAVTPATTAGSSQTGSRPVTFAANPTQLSKEQLAEVARLAATDRHVRNHEQAHLVAAGPYARGGPSYSYVTGPDGQQYAVGGEVSLDVSPVQGDPKATIQKAQVLEAAANAPVDPSAQDRAVAAAAAVTERPARRELEDRERLVRSAYSAADAPAAERTFSLVG